jgi:peptidylprolyl isomerase
MKSLGLKEYIAVAAGLGVIVLVFFFGGVNPFGSSGQNIPPSNNMTSPQMPANSVSQGEVVKEDIRIGTGKEAISGATVAVNYVLTLSTGTKIDSSYDRGEPLPFTLGAGGVIPGFDQGVLGMKVGGKRKVTIPSDLGYGPNDYGPIPGGSTLFFEVELVEVK